MIGESMDNDKLILQIQAVLYHNEKENISPTVKKMLSQQNNVQKLKNIFEGKSHNNNSNEDDNC